MNFGKALNYIFLQSVFILWFLQFQLNKFNEDFANCSCNYIYLHGCQIQMNINNKYIHALNVTNYHWGEQQYIIKYKAKDTGRPKRLDLTAAGDLHSHLKSGLADWCRWNSQYKKLVLNMEVHEWSNIDILEMFSAILNLQQLPEPVVDCSRDRDVGLESSWDSGPSVALRTASIIVYLRTTQNWSISSICLKFRDDKQQIVKIFQNYKFLS